MKFKIGDRVKVHYAFRYAKSDWMPKHQGMILTIRDCFENPIHHLRRNPTMYGFEECVGIFIQESDLRGRIRNTKTARIMNPDWEVDGDWLHEI